MDLHKFCRGESFDAYRFFGAHLTRDGVVFRTYAPNAWDVKLFGDFTGWQELPMVRRKGGVWEGCCGNAVPGQLYKYVIYGSNGRVEHCDPYGFGMELRPGGCSVIRDLKEYRFTDRTWMKCRSRCFDKPMNIYELHVGSWMKKYGQYHSYTEIADVLIRYLQEFGYNFVEFLPLAEHPFDGSWGYQGTGFFAPTSRYGTAAQLKELIDRLHRAGIGVIGDFVSVHFAVDDYGLRQYDGTALYESLEESEWGSFCFDLNRGEVVSFLQSAANYYLEEFHFDGLRLDAVSRLIYRRGEAWQGENEAGLRFLKQLNRGLHERHPTAMLIAEDSSAYPGVTADVRWGGLGFDYKWDMGWTYDTLEYLRCHPDDRAAMPDKLPFSFRYGRNECYILPLSHDEVVCGRNGLPEQLHGNAWEKLAQARLLHLYRMTHPGKKLSFMGMEFAMLREWNVWQELDWTLLQESCHRHFHSYVRAVNRVYLKYPALWARDHTDGGFYWVDCRCEDPRVYGYVRTNGSQQLLTVLNFSHREVWIDPWVEGNGRVLIHTDSNWGQEWGIPKSLPPYSGVLCLLEKE